MKKGVQEPALGLYVVPVPLSIHSTSYFSFYIVFYRKALVLEVVVSSPSFSLRPYSIFDWFSINTPVHMSLNSDWAVCHR